MELFTTLFSDLLVFVYHGFDPHCHSWLLERTVTSRAGCALLPPGRRRSRGQQRNPEPAYGRLPELARAFARNHQVPIKWAEKGVRKEDMFSPGYGEWSGRTPMVSTSSSRAWSRGRPFGSACRVFHQGSQSPHPRPPEQPLTHDYFYIRDGSRSHGHAGRDVFPLPDHVLSQRPQLIDQELNRAHIGFRKSDNAFLAVDEHPLQAAADKLNPAIIRERLDYWNFILGPKFSAKERKRINLSRFYSISQIEYCRNFIFKRNFPIHKLFERSCELGLWRLTANKIPRSSASAPSRLSGKLATVIDQIEHGHHVFRAYFKHAFLKQYEKFSTFLRTNSVPTTSPTSASRKDCTISKRSAKSSKPSPATSPPSRRNGSTFTSTFRCCRGSPCRSP